MGDQPGRVFRRVAREFAMVVLCVVGGALLLSVPTLAFLFWLGLLRPEL